MEQPDRLDERHRILIFEDRQKAVDVVRALQNAGISKERISFFVQASPEHGIPEPELLEAMDQGGFVGVPIGAVAGLGLFAIPGVGPVLATGSLATVLTGAVLGGCLGGVAGALAGAGLTEANAALAEHHLREGRAVVVVEEGDDDVKISTIAKSQGSLEIANA